MIYSAFGLGLGVSQAVPRLACAPVAKCIDVRIELNARPAWFLESTPFRTLNISPFLDASGAPMRTLSELPNGWLRLSYTDGTDFLLDRDGREIWATWPDELTVDDMSSYLLGPVMGFVLRLRGRVCLHASGIVADDRAFAIVGPPGAGKSTLAAAFAARGHAMLSDDVVPLLEANGIFQAMPGYPRVRLWPSSVEALATIDERAPILPPDWGERRYHLDIQQQGYTFQSRAVPLAAVYVLRERADRSAPSVGSLTGEEGLIALIANSFATMLLDRDMRAQDLEVLSRLAMHVPLRSLEPSDDLRHLSNLCDVVLEDFRSLDTPVLAQASRE